MAKQHLNSHHLVLIPSRCCAKPVHLDRTEAAVAPSFTLFLSQSGFVISKVLVAALLKCHSHFVVF